MSWSRNDIPDLTGRVAVVTGANSGLGLEVSRTLAGNGATVYLAVRNLAKGAAAVDDIKASIPAADLHLQELNLASLDSVRTAAAELRGRTATIDLLINNAGAMYTPRDRTDDGFGMQFGVNHLGHFAWTGLLIDRLLGTPGSRIATHSSVAHRGADGINIDALPDEPEDVGTLTNRLVFRNREAQVTNAAYGRSKLANLLFTYELQRRLTAAGASTIAVAAHPGLASTTLLQDIPGPAVLQPLIDRTINTVEEGALPILRAATDPSVLGGQFYGPSGPGGYVGDHPVLTTSTEVSYDADLQRDLWAKSEELTGVTFDGLIDATTRTITLTETSPGQLVGNPT